MPVELPDGGGGEEFAGAYTILSNLPAVELVGASDSQDVQEIVTQALPSNVIFTFRLLPEVADLSTIQSFASQFSGYFNQMSEIPGVGGVSTFQDITDSDQLQDHMRIVVRSTSGKSAQAYTETQFGRRLDFIAEDVTALRAQLDAIEASH